MLVVVIGIVNFVRTKNLVLNSHWCTLWATYLFYQNIYNIYVFTKKEYIIVQLTSTLQSQ